MMWLDFSLLVSKVKIKRSGKMSSQVEVLWKELLEEFMDIFKSYCRRYLNITGGYTRLRKLYLSQLWRNNEPAEFIDSTTGQQFKGTIKGLSEIGLLRVLDIEKGELKEFAFKEIGYII